MRALTDRLLTRSRKKWLRSRPLFEPYVPVSSTDIARVEAEVGAPLPVDMRDWLLAVGYGDVDEVLSFRYEWFTQVEQGHLRGAVIFAQDDLGNFYAFLPSDGSIIFFDRSAPEYTVLGPTFCAFMEELERRDYKLSEWVDSLVMSPYQWDVTDDRGIHAP
jgi:hypothetical protein